MRLWVYFENPLWLKWCWLQFAHTHTHIITTQNAFVSFVIAVAAALFSAHMFFGSICVETNKKNAMCRRSTHTHAHIKYTISSRTHIFMTFALAYRHQKCFVDKTWSILVVVRLFLHLHLYHAPTSPPPHPFLDKQLPLLRFCIWNVMAVTFICHFMYPEGPLFRFWFAILPQTDTHTHARHNVVYTLLYAHIFACA